MNFLQRLLKLCDLRIGAWSASDRQLTQAARPPEGLAAGSHASNGEEGRTFHGLKITMPLPEPGDQK